MARIIPALLALAFFMPVNLFAGRTEDSLYRKALKATFTSDKSVHTRALARLGTPEAVRKLLKLLKNDHYWNGQAAVNGLVLIRSRKVTMALYNAMKSDHMITDNIERGFVKNISRHFYVLVNVYRKESEKKYRDKIISIIGKSRIKKGSVFLKSIVASPSSEERTEAYSALVLNYPTGNYRYVKGHLHEPTLRLTSLSYLVKFGSKADCGTFLSVIKNHEDDKNLMAAYSGIHKYGTWAKKEEIFYNALKEKNEGLNQAAVHIFSRVKSKRIMRGLVRLVYRGEYQDTRIASALRLTEYNSKEVVPPLVVCLNETYQPKMRTGFDIFLGAITFGITSVLDHVSRKFRRSSFSSKLVRIGEHLKSVTGAEYGESYTKWFQWAVLNGYTVRGTNIIQYLFSGYPAIRRKAVSHAILLLGYKNEREFYSRNGTFQNDIDLSMKLARLLIKKGFMRNEIYSRVERSEDTKNCFNSR